MTIRKTHVMPLLRNPIRLITTLSALIFLFHTSYGQTNISGVVNSYYQVIAFIPAKACVRLNTVAGLSFNDKAMIVQMKGASINTSNVNASNFGDTTNLNNAGNYEIGTICNIKSDSVFFDYMFLNSYTVGSGVQLVRIPEYVAATVIDTLKAAPWSTATNTGGVLAIFVDQDLTLNAPVSGDTMGYRGGTYRLSNGTCSNFPGAGAYAYDPTTATQNGAYKGEGCSSLVTTQAGGRGAPANGGGGGNNHNNGGGGGANLNGGGDGGGNSSSTGCTLSLQGKAGKALSSYGGRKIFMGGGGGAGHANNGLVPSNGGGHGGGIVFIRANNIIGNGFKISANGQVGGPSLSDGASGGGAGGTIILNIGNYFGGVNIAANGAQGGTADDGGNLNKCYGSGGGGSGGVIYFSGAVPIAPVVSTVGAGAAGPEINHDASCNAAVASSPGINGQIIGSYAYTSSTVLSNSYCTTLLPVELLWFTAGYSNGQTILSWKTAQPELIDHFEIEISNDADSWTTLSQQVATDAIFNYSYHDLAPKPGDIYYRIKITKKTGVISYSEIRKVIVPAKNQLLTIYPNPASKKLFISGLNGSSQVTLFDQTGKIVLQKKIATSQASIEVDLPSLSKGVYIIKIDETIRKLLVD